MFSVQQKRDISDAVQKVLRATHHPELPQTGEISFMLHVDGAESWSFADIYNNGAVGDPGVNPHNELMASIPEEEARGLIDRAKELTEEKPDPRATPDEFMKEMLAKQLNGIQLDVQAHEKRLTQLEGALSAGSGTADSDINPLVTPMEQLRRVVTMVHEMEDKDKIHRKLYSELRFGLDAMQEFLTPIIEDNLIQHHDDQLRNLMTALGADDPSAKKALLSLPDRMSNIETAIKQLGTGQLLKDPKKCPDCGVIEGMEHAPDCTAWETKETVGDA